MDTVIKDVNLGVTLDPIYWDEMPAFKIEFNNICLDQGYLDSKKTFNWLLPAQDKNILKIYFINKKDTDTQENKDKVIIVEKINLEGFEFNSFLQAGKYIPKYPEGYYRYAKEHNLSIEPVISQTYMSFNGVWQLEFNWPIFEWIHQIENLGWLYERNI